MPQIQNMALSEGGRGVSTPEKRVPAQWQCSREQKWIQPGAWVGMGRVLMAWIQIWRW